MHKAFTRKIETEAYTWYGCRIILLIVWANSPSIPSGYTYHAIILQIQKGPVPQAPPRISMRRKHRDASQTQIPNRVDQPCGTHSFPIVVSSVSAARSPSVLSLFPPRLVCHASSGPHRNSFSLHFRPRYLPPNRPAQTGSRHHNHA